MPRRRRRNTSLLKSIIILSIPLGLVGYYFWTIKMERKNSPVELRALPETFKSYGIDVSHHQGTINWDLVLETNDTILSFVYCKATEGAHFIDHQFTTNIEALRERSIKQGAYHFFSPGVEPKAQARHFLNIYKYVDNDLPPVLDVETEGLSDERLRNDIREWISLIENEMGVRPIIYTSYHFYIAKFKGHMEDVRFWIANYNNAANKMTDREIIHWQYTDKGRIPGITGLVDLNMSKIKFD